MSNVIEGNNTYKIIEQYHLEYSDPAANSNKFWEICSLKLTNGTGSKFAVKTGWGRIGTVGQSNFSEFDEESGAKALVDAGVREKVRKGYIQTTKGVSSASAAEPEKKIKKPKTVEVETEWDLT